MAGFERFLSGPTDGVAGDGEDAGGGARNISTIGRWTTGCWARSRSWWTACLSPLGGPKQRGVVAVLVAAAGHPVSVDGLLQATYGEDAAPTSRATLQTYVSNLRNALGDVIVRQGDGYFVDCTNSAIDAAAFEDAYRTASSSGDPEECRVPVT